MNTIINEPARMKLIFVHIPKTAGTSLGNAISEKVGKSYVSFRYTRVGAKSPFSRKADCLIRSFAADRFSHKVAFGHFMVGDYARFNGLRFVKRENFFYATFLREPLQRAVSHYYFWKRTNVRGHKVWERFTREGWDLERFLLSSEIANLQSRFFWRFPLKDFDFVGISEQFEESVRMLSCAFPALSDLPIRPANTNPDRAADRDYVIDVTLANAFRQHNHLDYALYEQACEIFEQQRQRLKCGGAR